MICKLCGEWFDEKLENGLCQTCADICLADANALKELVEQGHTDHCAARMVWGDGECECGFSILNCNKGDINND